ncbi:MAG: hypothetical protein JWO38_4161 [Gemmataceae bacterium]|nr:hypothetical protein [Gemmataceae bacterium]
MPAFVTSLYCRAAVAAAAVALLLTPALASWPPPGVPSGMMPWQWQEYQIYKDRYTSPTQPAPAATAPHSYPHQSTLQVTLLPQQHTDPKPIAYVMVHLPKGADLWVEGTPMVTNNKEDVDTLVTPPLEKGMTYPYHIRTRWYEDGKWVHQMNALDVKAGDVVCVDVVPHDAKSVEKAVAAGLDKLSPADRKAAEAQKFCAVQDTIRLGSMGTPVKVTVNGKDVFLCCEGCRDAALKDLERPSRRPR